MACVSRMAPRHAGHQVSSLQRSQVSPRTMEPEGNLSLENSSDLAPEGTAPPSLSQGLTSRGSAGVPCPVPGVFR